jgi:hypothetical protein
LHVYYTGSSISQGAGVNSIPAPETNQLTRVDSKYGIHMLGSYEFHTTFLAIKCA